MNTSRGAALVELEGETSGGTLVGVTPFAEDEWETRSELWTSRYDRDVQGQTLSQFLVSMLAVPDGEADALAESILGSWTEWTARGDRQAWVTTQRWTRRVITGAAIVIALALVGLVAVIWLLAQAL